MINDWQVMNYKYMRRMDELFTPSTPALRFRVYVVRFWLEFSFRTSRAIIYPQREM